MKNYHNSNSIKCIKTLTNKNGEVCFMNKLVYQIILKQNNFITVTSSLYRFNIKLDVTSDYFKEHFVFL